MAVLSLIHRLVGISAICLLAVITPLTTAQRVALLAAFSLGLAVSAVLPGYDKLAARLVGPVVVALALAPPTTDWAAVHLLAALVAGTAAFNRAGMSRLAPALGLPLGAMLVRTGTTSPEAAVVAWAVLAVVVVLLGARRDLARLGPQLSPTGAAARRTLGLHRRHVAQGVGSLVVAATAAVLAAGPLAAGWAAISPIGGAGPGGGDTGGGAVAAHPGLSGGLDAGAPVVLDDAVVLRVAADRPLYWRATTYDTWDGRRWSRALGPAEDPTAGITDGTVPSSPDGPAPIEVTQTFTLVGTGLDAVPAAWRPTSVEMTDGAERDIDLGLDGSLAVAAPLEADSSWTVTSAVVPATADHLRAADPADLPSDAAVLAAYAVEGDVVPRVAELAASVTAEAPTTYDKIRALEGWMDDNLTYTRDLPRLDPGTDAVDELLFGSRRGYCEQIGSALVVMLRSLGIPARLVVGYVPGSYDGVTGEWLSRGTDAHAWAEVYFPGVGWQGFDPTAGVPLAGETPELRSVEGEAELPIGPVSVSMVAIAVVVAVALHRRRGSVVAPGAIAGRWRRRSSPRLDRLRRRLGRAAPTEGVTAVELLARVEEAGRRLGCAVSPTMTARDRGAALVEAGVDAAVVDRLVVAIEELAFFGAGPERPPEARIEAERRLAAVVRQLEWCLEVYDLEERAVARAQFDSAGSSV
ncbi:MAG: transglutaminaseTgpA domain-containing protein [Actinomycetota bacterium]